MYPQDTKYLIYNHATHRFVLTKDYIVEVLGIDLERRIGSHRGVNSTAIINSVLNEISIIVYNYIFKHNDTKTLLFIIAKCQSAQDIVVDAMREQARYVFTVGDLSLSTDKAKKEIALSDLAKSIIDNQVVEELGVPLSYLGQYVFYPPSYEKGEY